MATISTVSVVAGIALVGGAVVWFLVGRPPARPAAMPAMAGLTF
jgi:hypothetical protein